MEGLGAVGHEQIGHDQLLRLGLSARVARLVGGHVEAKRYLATRRAGYIDQLSTASYRTFQLQGGLMSDAELRAFEADPLHREMLAVRTFDEGGKDVEGQVPALSHWRDTLITHLKSQRANP
jgi:predicted HD phosphohydrolase